MSEFSSEAECDEYLNEEILEAFSYAKVLSIGITSEDPASGKCRFGVNLEALTEDAEDAELSGSGVFNAGVISSEGNGGTIRCALAAEKTADGKTAIKGNFVLVVDGSASEDIPAGMNAMYLTVDVDCVKK